MSKKQEPIINGIDVSECCFYNNGKCDNPNGMACNCINNAVCYFKELKRTRQINSELISKANAYDKLVILANDRLDIIDRLKQENEELKKRQITKNGFICDCEKNAKYKQALEEIRNIAEHWLKNDWSCYYCRRNIKRNY